MLASLKKMLGDKVKSFSGNKDFLEAVCAAAALVASADGKIDDSEIEATVKAIQANATLSNNFNSREIEKTAQEMLQRAAGGRVGRSGLLREIEEIQKDADMAEAVMLSAIDIAEADGTVDPEELKVMEKIAGILGQDLSKIMD